jgi:hypothetical protein
MDYITIAGVVIGSALIAIYGFLGYRKRTPVQLVNAAVLFLSGSGAVAGVKVIIFAFNPELLALVRKEGIDIAHVFLGGLAIFWVSVLSVIDIFRNLINKSTINQPQQAIIQPIPSNNQVTQNQQSTSQQPSNSSQTPSNTGQNNP